MAIKLIAPLATIALAALLYAQPHVTCAFMAFAKFAGHISL
jgi:hypothetical protein